MSVPANKSPFDKGGFRGNVNTDSRKKEAKALLYFRESAGASMLFHYSQIIKELCAFVNLHSHDTHFC